MKIIPTLAILTNRHRILVHRATNTGAYEVVESLDPMEGNESLSDLVTDQAASFPTEDPGEPAFDSLPFPDELEIRTEKQISAKIAEILAHEGNPTWGYAAEPRLREAVLDHLPWEYVETLTQEIDAEITVGRTADILDRFASPS